MSRPQKRPDESKFSGRLAARIRFLREKQGFSIDDFQVAIHATGLPVGKSTVYAWENGNASLNPDHLPFIAEALGVSVRTLMPNE